MILCDTLENIGFKNVILAEGEADVAIMKSVGDSEDLIMSSDSDFFI